MAEGRGEWRRKLPWFDAAGRWSSLKAAGFALASVPALWMADEILSGRWDFPSPFIGLIYFSGLWATYLLLGSLLVTPLRRIGGWGRLAQVRRMLGVASFMYCVLHLLAWFGLRFWDWGALGGEWVGRLSLWIATLSLLILLALAATSFDGAIRSLGKRWKQLHRLAYLAALLAVLHFLMSPGSLQGAPFLMAGLYGWTMGWRLLDRRAMGDDPVALGSLGVSASLLTLLLQPVWLLTFQAERAPQAAWAALADNLNPQVWQYLGVPPVWIMLGWTLATVAVAVWKRTKTLRKPISGVRLAP